MHFKAFQPKPFLTCLCAALVYPLIVLVRSEKKLLKFIDALTITGLVFLRVRARALDETAAK